MERLNLGRVDVWWITAGAICLVAVLGLACGGSAGLAPTAPATGEPRAQSLNGSLPLLVPNPTEVPVQDGRSFSCYDFSNVPKLRERIVSLEIGPGTAVIGYNGAHPQAEDVFIHLQIEGYDREYGMHNLSGVWLRNDVGESVYYDTKIEKDSGLREIWVKMGGKLIFWRGNGNVQIDQGNIPPDSILRLVFSGGPVLQSPPKTIKLIPIVGDNLHGSFSDKGGIICKER